MVDVVLDTSFILTCVKQKIDFFEDLGLMGLKILIPKQVVRELKSMKANSNAQLSLQILDKNEFREVDMEIKNVDQGIINYAQKHRNVFIATLDREIKNKVNNSNVVIRGKKRLEIL